MGVIIGVSGKAGVGKDFFADLLLKSHPHFYKIGFADELKKMASIVGDFDLADAYTQAGKQKMIPWLGITIREFLQKFGTDCMRNGMDQDFWVKKLMNKIPDEDVAVIPDMRFKNEFYALKKRNAITVRIDRFLTCPEWEKLTGINSSLDYPPMPRLSGKLTKAEYLSFLRRNYYELCNEQIKILDGLEHISETELDDVKHDINILHSSDMEKGWDKFENYINEIIELL